MTIERIMDRSARSASLFVACVAGACVFGVGMSVCGAPIAARDHWAYQRPIDPPIPAVKDSSWVKNPVDAFVLAKLEEAGLKPSPPADRRTLIRRAYFDLIGLPPTPREVEDFVADASPDAFEHLVDRLLDNPHYGERWGRYWLDVARYADTKGYVFQEERKYPYAYTYRDYVIRAFNEDKPYDQFLIEQIAADKLPLGDDKSALAAMGFLTLGRRFINVTPDIIDDRMDVVCRGTMGVTIGCARCHNHKFDPIPTADYYSLYSIFNNSHDAGELPLIGEPYDKAAYARFKKELADRQQEVDAFFHEEYDKLIPPLRSAKKISQYLMATRLRHIDPQAYAAAGVGPNPYLVDRWKGFLRHAADKHDSIFRPWRTYSEIKGSDFAEKARLATDMLVKFKDKRPVHPLVLAAFINNPPTSLQDAADRYGALLANFNFAEKLPNESDEQLREVLFGEDAPTDVPHDKIEELFLQDSREHLIRLNNKIAALKADSPGAPPRAMVLQDSASFEPQRVFLRGNPGNQGEEVKPHFLTCIAGENPPTFTNGSGRLELAQAIASRENPLTARVMANRVWLHHFGFGLVRTPSDFGSRGDPPTHPQLLDYLATHFMKGPDAAPGHPWSIKNLQRLIMLSSTYQMSSEASDDATARDPQNLLLSHFNRQRLDFEATRDALLVVSGKFDATLYGRSIDIAAEPFSMRRTIYAFIDRQNLPGIFRAFDFASPDATCPRRFTTTVPQQALFMMNSPFVVQQSKAVLERPEIAATNDSKQKIESLYQLMFNRQPSEEEASLGLTYVESESRVEQDAAIWQYGYGEFDEGSHRIKSFTAFKHFAGGQWRVADKIPEPITGFASLTAGGGHPGMDVRHPVIRRWTSPIDGVVKISGTLAHHEPRGDGVRGRIVSSRDGDLAAWNVFQSEAETTIDNIEVKRGDTIDFIVDCRGGDECDSFSWAPNLRTTDAPTLAGADSTQEWSAAEGFGGPERTVKSLSAWEKYVQVLLESNEFVFVD